MHNIIEVKNLTKSYKTRTNKNLITGLFNPNYEEKVIVDDVSFNVKEGEALAFLGPNGAGKTTTTKMLTGLVYPSLGSVKVMGYTPFERKKEFLMQIGLVMGNKSGLNWDLTGEQSFRFVKNIYQIEDKKFNDSVNELCEVLDVKKHLNKQVRKLSLGERMKMEMIASILHNPKVLFLDEPSIGLDVTAKKNIRKFLKDMRHKYNITLILTSHDMDDIEKVCDRVVVINKGKKVYDDDITKLTRDFRQEKFIKIYFEELPKDLSIFDSIGIEKIEEDSVTFVVKSENTPKLIATAMDKYKVLDIDIVPIPLEEIIEDIYKTSSGAVSSIL